MPVCTFFGHRDCPETVKTNLFSAIEKLITLNDVRIFYVGNHGNFDRLVVSVLKELKNKYCIWETLDEYVKQYAEYIEKEIQLISPDILDSITDKIKQTKTTFPVYIVNSSNMGYCIYENHLELVENNE